MISNITLIASYHLTRFVGINKIFSTLAAVLYLANPYSIFYVWRILNANIILYATLPLIFLCILKIVRSESTKKYVLILVFAEFMSISGFINPAYYFPFLMATLVLSLSYSFIIIRSSIKLSIKNIILKNLIILTLLVLPITSYVFSILSNQQEEASVVSQYFQGAESTYDKNTEHMTLVSLFSLTGLPPLYEPAIWFSYEYIYVSTIAIVVALVVVFIIFIVLTLKLIEKCGVNKNIYPFIIILVISLILMLKETGHPIFQNYPAFLAAFRDPYHKFGSVYTLALIILFSYCSQEVLKIKIVKKNKFLQLGMILIISIPVIYWISPFLSGNFIPTQVKINDRSFSAFTDLPYKYMPAIDYLKQDKDVVSGNARLIVYPLIENDLWCDGDRYLGNDILRFSGISDDLDRAPRKSRR